MPIIYHIAERAAWDAAQQNGQYAAPSLKEEGFIHCSMPEQVSGVLDRYFKGKVNLVKLSIDTEKLKSQLIYEWSPSIEQTFPHVYGSINTSSVMLVENISA